MAANSPIVAGTVDWSGENPGMSLKESAEGPFATLLSFFRVALSPHGRGHALVMLRAPGTEGSSVGAENLCITDNEPLARWLVAEYLSHFAHYRDVPALRGLAYEPMIGVETSGDTNSTYGETVRGHDLEVRLSWEELGEPFAVHMPVARTATGKHEMLSVFVSAERGVATVNGHLLPGRPIERDVSGRKFKSTFLAFSETWIRP